MKLNQYLCNIYKWMYNVVMEKNMYIYKQL